MVAGVCGGLAEWLDWDPTLVRILYVVASILSFAFAGLTVYLILWAIMPQDETGAAGIILLRRGIRRIGWRQDRAEPTMAEARSLAPEVPSSNEAQVDINTVTLDELARLPGMDRVAAGRAIAVRQQRGGFASIQQFEQAVGLKPHIVAKLRPKLTVAKTPPGAGRPAAPRRAAESTDDHGRVIDL